MRLIVKSRRADMWETKRIQAVLVDQMFPTWKGSQKQWLLRAWTKQQGVSLRKILTTTFPDCFGTLCGYLSGCNKRNSSPFTGCQQQIYLLLPNGRNQYESQAGHFHSKCKKVYLLPSTSFNNSFISFFYFKIANISQKADRGWSRKLELGVGHQDQRAIWREDLEKIPCNSPSVCYLTLFW